MGGSTEGGGPAPPEPGPPGPPRAAEGSPFRLIVERGADGVAVLDDSGAIVYANAAAAALLGRPIGELLGRPLGLPLVASRPAELDVPQPGGPPRIVELRSAEGDWGGRPVVLIGLRDVTAHRRLADGQRFLARAGAALARSLDLPETLDRTAGLIVGELADACLIDLIRPDGAVVRRAARHALPELDAALAPLRGGLHVDPAGPVGLPRALRTGRPKLYGRATAAALDSLAADEGPRRVIRGLGVGSLMILPLVARGATLGALTLLTTRPGRHFSAADVPTAAELAALAALALDNARLYDEARDAVRRRDEFLAMLSHELRNPLASIVHAAALLRPGGPGPGPPAQGRAAEVVARQAEQMGRLLEDLLDLSRLTRGTIRVDRRRIDLLDVLGDALEAARPALDAAGHRLHLELPGGPIPLDGDPARLSQVLVNLLTNAARYTPPGGNVRLEVRAGPGGAEVVVRDDGVGIEPELLPRIFELFVQGGRGLDRRQGGLGIGLTLVKELVERHGGSVSASSDGPGLGSAFRVLLPTAGPESRSPLAPAAPAPPEADGIGPLRILIVEDHDANREMLGALLDAHGHRVEAAADGREALDALARRPDLALIDLGLPGIDGLTLARAARSDPALRDLVLVALTGYARPEDRAASLAAGFDDHLAKPVRIGELNRLIARLARPRPPDGPIDAGR